MTPLRDASELLWPAVQETLHSLDLGSEHAAAKKLAQRYAQVIDHTSDQAWAMRWIAPLLLDCLESLGATPAGKAAITKGGGQQSAPESPLAALRKAHGKRPA